jgi:hypothetical protein
MRYTVAIALLLAAGAAQADIVQVGPSKDNTLFETAGGELSSGAGDGIYAGKIAFGTIRRGLIAFNIAGSVPAGATITGVSLTLTAIQVPPGGTPANVALHRLTADWGEGTSNSTGGQGAQASAGDATWIHRFHNTSFWATPGGDFAGAASATQSVGGPGAYTWSSPAMLADVQGWFANPSSNFGWLVLGDETFNSSARRFGSRESVAAARPVLAITYIPTPGAATALGLGGLLLGARRRR